MMGDTQKDIYNTLWQLWMYSEWATASLAAHFSVSGMCERTTSFKLSWNCSQDQQEGVNELEAVLRLDVFMGGLAQ